MSVSDLMTSLREEAEKRVYFSRFDVFEETFSLLKARLYISPSIFVQIYRNDRFNTTNFVLVYNGERIFARDQLNGIWHRHLTSSPDVHDTSDEGLKPVSLPEFLDEVEIILAEMGLP
jgi:hypothetical protein